MVIEIFAISIMASFFAHDLNYIVGSSKFGDAS
jgi:hypothetical protein